MIQCIFDVGATVGSIFVFADTDRVIKLNGMKGCVPNVIGRLCREIDHNDLLTQFNKVVIQSDSKKLFEKSSSILRG